MTMEGNKMRIFFTESKSSCSRVDYEPFRLPNDALLYQAAPKSCTLNVAH